MGVGQADCAGAGVGGIETRDGVGERERSAADRGGGEHAASADGVGLRNGPTGCQRDRPCSGDAGRATDGADRQVACLPIGQATHAVTAGHGGDVAAGIGDGVIAGAVGEQIGDRSRCAKRDTAATVGIGDVGIGETALGGDERRIVEIAATRGKRNGILDVVAPGAVACGRDGYQCSRCAGAGGRRIRPGQQFVAGGKGVFRQGGVIEAIRTHVGEPYLRAVLRQVDLRRAPVVGYRPRDHLRAIGKRPFEVRIGGAADDAPGRRTPCAVEGGHHLGRGLARATGGG